MGGQHDIVEGYHNQIRYDVMDSIPRTDGTLIDVGGGTGATAAHVKSLGLASRVGTVDMVRPESTPDGVDFQFFGNIEDGGFLAEVVEKEGPFGTILCLDILEHLVDPWKLVASLGDALAPGGRIVASIPNVRHYRVSGALFFKDSWRLDDAGILDRTHLRFFVKETAVELMTSSGLQLESVEAPKRTRHRRRVAAFHKLTGGKLNSLVDVQYVVVVRKAE
ncbi:MAG TPA: methyltransferase domain-containing protein [Nocardioidaceae bacterium]|nr:methyltransferase domain-containing protein [Nocardioidaceae bacterium]